MNTINNIRFIKRPISIPPDYRPIYKIGQIVLILGICCRGNKASLLILHLFMWAMKTESNAKQLVKWLNNDRYKLPIWSIEPTLNRGLQYASAENICIKENEAYKLTDKGLEFFKLLCKENDIMECEKELLSIIGKTVTNKKIYNLTQDWIYDKD